MAAPETQGRGLTAVQWLICFIAALGFAFDIYELLMLPLVVKPALAALGGVGPDGIPLLVPGSPGYVMGANVVFHSCNCRWNFWSSWRLPDRPAGAQAGVDFQHIALRIFGVRIGLCNIASPTVGASLFGLHRRVR